MKIKRTGLLSRVKREFSGRCGLFLGLVLSAVSGVLLLWVLPERRGALSEGNSQTSRLVGPPALGDQLAGSGNRGPVPERVVPVSEASVFQEDTGRPEGLLTAEARKRLQEALARLRHAPPRGALPPIVAPAPVDPALVPRPQALSAKQNAALGLLRWRSGKDLDFRAFSPGGTLSYLAGMMLEPPAETIGEGRSREEETARSFLAKNRDLLLLNDPEVELRLEREERDSLGYVQLRFSQHYQDLPVWPAGLTVQIKPGGAASLFTGNYVATPEHVRLEPRLSRAEAQARAEAAAGASLDAPDSGPELIVYAASGDPVLAYKAEIHANLSEHWTVIVDANDGRVLDQINKVCTAAVVGSGTDLGGSIQQIDLWQHNDGFYYMVDTAQPMYDPSSSPPFLQNSRGVIKIVDAGDQEPQGANVNFTDVRSNSTTTGFSAEAVSASVNLARVYNYYRERYNRNSIDGQGGSILGVVNVRMDNAFWNGTFIALGNGDTWANSLDFDAHEMTHGVISRTSNLVYQNQSGALNEAFADILGEGCEAHYQNGNLDWILGSGLSRGLRSMRDPASIPIGPGIATPYPKKMSEFLTTTHPDPVIANIVQRDSGGVHFNSSIINHCFYLLTTGLPGAIGLDQGLQIFYRTVTTKLNQQSTFIDCRLGCIASATELFGAGSNQATKVAEAFDAVEIYDQRPPSMPSPIPVVSSNDNTLFTYTPDFFTQFLGRLELAQGDGQVGVQLGSSTVNAGSTPSVSGDGSFAIFVDAAFDAVIVDTLTGESEALGLAGQVYSVGMSANGETFGFVFLDQLLNPANRVSVIDIATGAAVEYDLAAPIYDQRGTNTASPILFAHVLDFTPDSRYLYYDALNRIVLESGYTEDLWSIYFIDRESGNTYVVIPPIPGANVGNPALAQAHNHYLAFEAVDGFGVHYLYAADLVDGGVNSLGAIAGGTSMPFFSRPGYNGDDGALVYTDYSFDAFIGWIPRVDHVPMAANGIETSGQAQIWLNTAVVGTPTVRGVIYRRGVYQGLPTVTAAVVDGTASEEGGDQAVFRVSRTGDTGRALNVICLLTGSAENGVDYERVPLTVDIPAGQAAVDIVIHPIDDGEPEPEEQVVLTLTEATHYTLGSPVSAQAVLIDNDELLGETFASWAAGNGIAADDYTGDPDGDLLVHLIEYGLGLDPREADASDWVTVSITEAGGERYLTLDLRRARKASDLEYAVEVSPGLEPVRWASGAAAILVLEDSETRLRVRDQTPVTPGQPFRAMRLRVVKED
ncbi:MAG TPA: M4 family metallopeptidase [Verrucomicrobiales bacterium]|nr:M4 family metallopeptidase [Verrucomicrobiales bacterium]